MTELGAIPKLGTKMKYGILKKADPINLIRLAYYLNLKIDNMGHKQIARLITWRLHPNRKRF